MRTSRESRYDPAPLQWLRGEIEQSLAKARENLDLVSANPADANAIQSVAADLHEVTGALLMVGLGAAARLNEETEKLIDTFRGSVPPDAAHRVLLARQSTVSLSTYLDGLVAGKPDHPMELAASYVLLNQARGASDASPNDLFSPDLGAAGLDTAVGGGLPLDDLVVQAISRCRGMFQAGLLELVRNKDLAGGARHMCDAILALEALDATLPSRAFWFTTVGFLDAVANDPVGAGSLAVQLFGRIDRQIKRLVEADHHVPEKLFRDMLLVVGRSTARTARIEQIREIYQLDELLSLPGADAKNKPDKKLVPIVDALRDQISGMKDALQLFAGGSVSALAPLAKQAALLATIGQQLPNREMVRLLQLLGAVGRHLAKVGTRPTEVQALEIATALLFAESSLEDYFTLGADFEQQASRICLRIQGAMTGVDLPGFNHSVASLSDTGTLQAQTHLLVLQVGKEVQANLDLIESALDAFFRDASKCEGLASLGNLFRQVRGAFSMLEEYDAAALAGILAERVDPFASGAVRGEGDEAAAVAEGVSALGLYVERLQQGSPDARAVMLPALMRFGIAKKPPPARKLRGKGPVEKAVAETTQEGAGSPRDEAPAAAAAPVAPAALAALAIAREVLPSPGQDAACGPTATALPALPMDSTDVPSIAFPVPLPVAPRAGHASIAAGELEQLRRAEAGLKIGIEERDQRIRALQIQMVALHREARKAAALKAELKDLRAALAHAEKKAH